MLSLEQEEELQVRADLGQVLLVLVVGEQTYPERDVRYHHQDEYSDVI